MAKDTLSIKLRFESGINFCATDGNLFEIWTSEAGRRSVRGRAMGEEGAGWSAAGRMVVSCNV